jgi:hypothetical protein
MAVSPPDRPRRHLKPDDLRAAAQLATQATLGVIGITEGVHQAVRRRVGLSAGDAPERAGGLTGRVYRAIRGAAHGLGAGIDGVLQAVLPLLDDPARAEAGDSPAREAVVAALNGVLGDRLAAMGNALAQPMQMRRAERVLPLSRADRLQDALGPCRPHVLLMVHGLCMNDTQWLRNGHDHTDVLSEALQATPVRLRYNSGLRIAANGRELAQMLERLMDHWPVPPQGITVVGHSMGGLLARSAWHEGRRAQHRWPALVKHLVFLGTPHHGAPLERAGHGADLLLASSPYSAPLARLGRLRSAGITDLRYGHLRHPDEGRVDAPLPLPEGVACFGVAACLAPRRGLLAERLVGDGLVPLRSALGEHDEPARRLVFARGRLRVVHRTGHLDLLSSQEVAAQLRQWLAAAPPARAD